ncbi:hypothetical protein L0664_05595 [Octadecabacter sp. G9-8]|uniref:Uncharacterized protein n=1 Tax=Octadecabacter dasysiphoniae TaxID=2909341 RepID=A0ABS9CUP6_9RHOB|nr:hypothetical protein [Octadecabacter dasysiphoniae]MCF2870534.1 hypothetical protein [Octadecabacter dasysiphoniae]
MQEADHILIPLLSGTHALAQVVQVEADNAVLFITRRPHVTGDKTIALADADVLAIVAVSLANLPENHWRIIGYDAIPDLNRTKTDFASDDVVLHDPAIVEAFANAIHGLYPWDGFPDPHFFTNLLRAPSSLPTRARMTADLPKPS